MRTSTTLCISLKPTFYSNHYLDCYENLNRDNREILYKIGKVFKYTNKKIKIYIIHRMYRIIHRADLQRSKVYIQITQAALSKNILQKITIVTYFKIHNIYRDQE